MKSSPKPGSRMLATRNSLIERLGDWEDRAKWQEFFDTYWRLIYGVARKSGLSDAEAQDVVQETVVSVAKNIGRYDKKAGSFKSARTTAGGRRRSTACRTPPARSSRPSGRKSGRSRSWLLRSSV